MRFRPHPKHATALSGRGWRLRLQQAYDAQRRVITERDRALAHVTQARAEVERLTGVVEDMASRIQHLLNVTSQQFNTSATAPSLSQALLAEANREIAMQNAVIEGLVGRMRALVHVAGIEVVLGEDGWRYRIVRLGDAWDGPFDTADQAVTAAVGLLLARSSSTDLGPQSS